MFVYLSSMNRVPPCPTKESLLLPCYCLNQWGCHLERYRAWAKRQPGQGPNTPSPWPPELGESGWLPPAWEVEKIEDMPGGSPPDDLDEQFSGMRCTTEPGCLVQKGGSNKLLIVMDTRNCCQNMWKTAQCSPTSL